MALTTSTESDEQYTVIKRKTKQEKAYNLAPFMSSQEQQALALPTPLSEREEVRPLD